MDAHQIVIAYLDENHYQGLYKDECGCFLYDLAPCGAIGLGCIPGYRNKHSVTGAEIIASDRFLSDEQIQEVIDSV